MPPQVQKSGILAKYGKRLDEAIQKHANDETTYGIIKIPGGINQGIAQLTHCYFALYKTGNNKGEAYLRAQATILEPHTAMDNGQEVVVRGLQTSVMFPVCQQKNTLGDITTEEEQIRRIENFLRSIGGEQATANLKSGADLESLALSIQEAKPFIKFSTSFGKAMVDPKTKEKLPPRVFENWHGSRGLEDYQPEDATESGVRDATVHPSTPSNGQKTRQASNGTAGRPKAPAKAPEPTPAFDDQGDTDTLLQRANDGDEEARALLTEYAVNAGHDEQVVNDTNTWEEVVEMIRNPVKGEAGDDEPVDAGENVDEPDEPSAPEIPAVGDVVKYKAPDKSGKPGKPVDCEILTVSTKNGTVTLKNLVTNAPVVGKDKKPVQVKWSDLEG